ncbi:family 78 glycoside hydrolase catalytic domain [Nonomuraea angiospora]|uniref:family 78 glycoside hydrolase catalytic domain n=1 Tax=Nonomuraea angiospora TaxID=46172 RepID=UPI0037953231
MITTTAPTHLRVEHLDEAVGICVVRPRLSWRLPTDAAVQTAYQIRTSNGWDSGRTASDDNLLIPYAGPPLRSSEHVEWQVKIWTDRGESDWSVPGSFETGLLHPDDWQAEWITPGQPADGTPGARPAALLRFEFDVDTPVASARLYATAHGIYEGFLNGERIGSAELTPGFTQYRSRLQVQTYDITSEVVQGRNAIGVILADGWYRGLIGYFRHSDQWGSRLALLVQMRLTHSDGTVTVLGTGPQWRSSTEEHVVAADLIAGERWDLRQLPHGWSEPGFDDTAWPHAATDPRGFDTLADSPAPPVRRIEELTPVSIRRLDEHRQVVDLGQNINGWVRLSKLGPAGTTVRLVHGEWLDASGDVTTDNLAITFPDPKPAGQIDEVTSAGVPGEVFEPRRTTHGFQYIRIEGHPEDLTPDDVTGIVVHTDLRRTGWFACSDERINRLHEAVVWSLRGNACDIPTDCPHRERAGWTGDWQLFVPSAAFLFDVAGFSVKWLRDVAADQRPDGTVVHFSPYAPDEAHSIADQLNGSAGWGDAAVIVPWEVYLAYGDTEILAESWPVITAWLSRIERSARTERHPRRAAARPTPEPHEQYLWDAGSHWGEWLVPGEQVVDLTPHARLDQGDIATAYYAYSTDLAARIAEVLGYADEVKRYRTLSEKVRAAWQAEYIGPEGRLTPDTQANHVRALAFDLVPTELRPKAAARLTELVREAGTHLGTGFLATPYLLPVLADTGHLDLAYDLLRQDTEPSWLVMIDRGATTVWENWNGVTADGTVNASLNHYSKGAVVSFLHRHVAGIELLEPGYRRFLVRPRPGGGLTWAEAVHESPYGRIEMGWRLDDGHLHVQLAVPAGTEATVVLPSGRQKTAGPGTHVFMD